MDKGTPLIEDHVTQTLARTAVCILKQHEWSDLSPGRFIPVKV